MPYSVFISHSAAPQDESFITSLAAFLQSVGVECNVARRDWKFGSSIVDDLESVIRGSDCVFAVVLAGGTQLAYVNQELGIAMDMSRRIYPAAEIGVDLTGFRGGLNWATLDRATPAGDPLDGIGIIALNALGMWLRRSPK